MSEISTRTLGQLQLLADRLKNNPDYLAGVFSYYQKIESLSDVELMQILEASPLAFSRLAICRRPAIDSPDFTQELRQIADYAETDHVILANIIRQVDSLQALHARQKGVSEMQPGNQPTHVPSGLLAAARDQMDQEQEAEDGISELEDPGNDREGRHDLADE
jgi:hypothetical protein